MRDKNIACFFTKGMMDKERKEKEMMHKERTWLKEEKKKEMEEREN